MDLTLRPMSTSQILDRTFSLYRQNFVLFAGIAALPPAFLLIGQVLLLAVSNPMSQGPFGGPSTGAPAPEMIKVALAGLGFLVLLVVALVGYAFASGASVLDPGWPFCHL